MGSAANSAHGIANRPNEVSILYLFAGPSRHCDVGDWLRRLSPELGFIVQVTEIDLLRPGGPGVNDVLDTDIWNSIIQRIKAREFIVVITTPPCNTHSRARYANANGPRPLRSKQWPWGFPWLEGQNLLDCELGNRFIRLSYEVIQLAADLQMGSFMEHPEDLGLTSSGDLPGSVWAVEATFQLAERVGAKTAAFFQCPFGAETSKPTRILTTLPLIDPTQLVLSRGWPRFAPKGKYMGPLPDTCGHRHKPLIGRGHSGKFRTSSSASYPPQMCKWIAHLVLAFCAQRRDNPVLKVGGNLTGLIYQENTSSRASTPRLNKQEDQEEQDTSEEDEEGIPRPLLKDHRGGIGPPLTTCWA